MASDFLSIIHPSDPKDRDNPLKGASFQSCPSAIRYFFRTRCYR
jgi:hypothetical protein